MGVRELFRDQQQTEFIIATIPTSLGVRESDRLARALQRERIPCKRIIVNQARSHTQLWGRRLVPARRAGHKRALARCVHSVRSAAAAAHPRCRHRPCSEHDCA